jgi:serine/threonine-protein phosphatase 2A regulatory subunit B
MESKFYFVVHLKLIFASRCFISGSYDDNFFLYDSRQKSGQMINASLAASMNQKRKGNKGLRSLDKSDEFNVDSLNFTKKSLHVSFNPKINVLAVTSVNNLYLYQKY